MTQGFNPGLFIAGRFFTVWATRETHGGSPQGKPIRKASLVAQTVKNLPAMPETWVWYLGWEDPLNKIPLQYSDLENSMGCIIHVVAKSWTWLSDFHFHRDSCLENSMNRGAWRATVRGVTKNRTKLSYWLSDQQPNGWGTMYPVMNGARNLELEGRIESRVHLLLAAQPWASCLISFHSSQPVFKVHINYIAYFMVSLRVLKAAMRKHYSV